jgi:hypothetical protein
LPGYVDNVATAQTLAAMQNQASGKVRMVLSTDQECNVPPDGSTPIESSPCSLFDLAALFVNGYDAKASVSPGDPVIISWGSSQPAPIVFARDWSSITFSAVTGSAPSGGNASAYTAEVSTTTVANPAFGVKAGTPVELLLVAANLPVGGWVHPQDYAAIQKYATAIGDSTLDQVIAEWLART